MSQKIITRPLTPEYEENWERIFGNKKVGKSVDLCIAGIPIRELLVEDLKK